MLLGHGIPNVVLSRENCAAAHTHTRVGANMRFFNSYLSLRSTCKDHGPWAAHIIASVKFRGPHDVKSNSLSSDRLLPGASWSSLVTHEARNWAHSLLIEQDITIAA